MTEAFWAAVWCRYVPSRSPVPDPIILNDTDIPEVHLPPAACAELTRWRAAHGLGRSVNEDVMHAHVPSPNCPHREVHYSRPTSRMSNVSLSQLTKDRQPNSEAEKKIITAAQNLKVCGQFFLKVYRALWGRFWRQRPHIFYRCRVMTVILLSCQLFFPLLLQENRHWSLLQDRFHTEPIPLNCQLFT